MSEQTYVRLHTVTDRLDRTVWYGYLEHLPRVGEVVVVKEGEPDYVVENVTHFVGQKRADILLRPLP